MIEVFKTDVQLQIQANALLEEIHEFFKNYTANFDLGDCDNILRIKSADYIDPFPLIRLLNKYGFKAEVLSDIVRHASHEILEKKVAL